MSKPQDPVTRPYPVKVLTLLKHGHAGNCAVPPQLKRAFDRFPDLAREFGDMPRIALESLLNAASGRSLTKREAIRREVDRLRVELAGPDAPLPVRLIAERVTIAWIAVHRADLRLALQLEMRSAEPKIRAAERRAKAAQARYVAAIEALVRVRMLTQPIRPDWPTNAEARQNEAGPPSSRGDVPAMSA
jgi:hypothetical protein